MLHEFVHACVLKFFEKDALSLQSPQITFTRTTIGSDFGPVTAEVVILKFLKEEAEEKTVLLVSHGESTMRSADEILAMEGGRIS